MLIAKIQQNSNLLLLQGRFRCCWVLSDYHLHCCNPISKPHIGFYECYDFPTALSHYSAILNILIVFSTRTLFIAKYLYFSLLFLLCLCMLVRSVEVRVFHHWTVVSLSLSTCLPAYLLCHHPAKYQTTRRPHIMELAFKCSYCCYKSIERWVCITTYFFSLCTFHLSRWMLILSVVWSKMNKTV